MQITRITQTTDRPWSTDALPALIGVAGRKRAGKGTVAAWLQERHGYELVKFADPLKGMLRTFFQGWGVDAATVERLIEGDLKETPLPAHGDGMPACLGSVMMGGRSARHAMQTLGTEWRHTVDDGMWMAMARSRVQAIQARGGRAVIDDMRFPFEADAVESMGGTLLKVTNSRLPPATDAHASEAELPDDLFTHILANNGSFEALHAHLKRLFPEDQAESPEDEADHYEQERAWAASVGLGEDGPDHDESRLPVEYQR